MGVGEYRILDCIRKAEKEWKDKKVDEVKEIEPIFDMEKLNNKFKLIEDGTIKPRK
jgi:hypothetical protein